jgi:ParB family chromosome partitioning protein
MLTSADNWSVDVQPTASRKETTTDSVAASKGAAIFEKERAEVFLLLGLETPKPTYGTDKRVTSNDVIELFAALMKVDDAAVLRALTLAMASSLAAGSRAVEALTHTIPIDMTDLWSPDDAFFDLLRDKKVINALVADIAGERCADRVLTDTGKAQKTVIRNRMAGIGVQKAASDWRPRWMQIPARHYLDSDGCSPAKLEHAVSKVITPPKKAKAA